MQLNRVAEDLLAPGEFDKRVSWAVSRGVPQWLWPHVEPTDWQNGLHSIERVAREILSTGKANEPLEGPADAIGVAAYTSGMGPLLGFWLAEGRLTAPSDIGELLARHYRHNSERMRRLVGHTVEVVQLLGEGGIPVTVLKGMDSALNCFPALGARATSDIDLFVAPSDRLRTESILSGLGYSAEHKSTLPDEQFWRHRSSALAPQSLAMVHKCDPWGIDLHTSTNRRYALGSPVIRLDDLVSRVAVDPWRAHAHAQVLAPVPAALFLACHAGCDLSSMRMVRLVELVMLVRRTVRGEAFSWREFAEIGGVSGTLPHAYAALSLATSLVPDAIPLDVLERARCKVPPAALRVLARLTPATAQVVFRCSAQERYMWTPSLGGRIRQIAHDLFPTEMPASKWLPTFKRRLLRVRHGTFSLLSH